MKLWPGLLALVTAGLFYGLMERMHGDSGGAGEGDRAERAAAKVGPKLQKDLAQKGLKLGDPVFIRIFKEERRLEMWLRSTGREKFTLFRSYRIAGMSGKLGPKLAEGDRQAPEGFYYVGRGGMNPQSRFHLSFNIGYPNAYDRAHGRTGSFIMVHGARVSIGCFAMTDAKIEEIYTLCDAALSAGQPFFRVHVFPFVMSAERMEEAEAERWFSFWQELLPGYQHFEKHGRPPEVRVRDRRYRFLED